MKKILVPITFLLVISFLVIGCSSGSSTPTAPVTSFATPTTGASTAPTATSKPTVSSVTTNTPGVTNSPTASAVTDAAKSGGTLRYIMANPVTVPIGWTADAGGGGPPSMQFAMEKLFREQMGGKLEPELATSYDVDTSADHPSVTFHLRKGVKFSDGSDFNAQAAKWSYEMLKASGQLAVSTRFWKSFEVIDDNTLKVNLTTWTNRIVRSFSESVAFVESPTSYQKMGLDWIRYHQVGTGPFLQQSYLQDVSLTLTRNPSYWDAPKPYLDRLQILYVSDEMTREALMKSGGAEILESAGNGRVAQDFQNLPGYQVATQSQGSNFLVPDSGNASSAWSNIKVRQAAEYAINKAGIASALGYGYLKPAPQFSSPSCMAYDPKIEGRNYDVAKAKQLLADAGFPNGFKTTITSQIQYKDVVTAIQANLAAVGIQAQLQFPEPAQYQTIITSNGSWSNGLVFMTGGEWANPNVEFNLFFGTPVTYFAPMARPDGWTDICNASFTTAAPDPAATQKIEDAMYNNSMVIPVYYGYTEWILKNNVLDTGFGTRGTTMYWNSWNTWLKK